MEDRPPGKAAPPTPRKRSTNKSEGLTPLRPNGATNAAHPAKAARRRGAWICAGLYRNGGRVSAPSLSKTGRNPRRSVRALGRVFTAENYKPQFALGIVCSDEADQRSLHAQLSGVLPTREVRVLVI